MGNGLTGAAPEAIERHRDGGSADACATNAATLNDGSTANSRTQNATPVPNRPIRRKSDQHPAALDR